MINFIYSVDDTWYQDVYKDKAKPCKAGRSFKLIHTPKSSKAVLAIHGYAGYPGELVRPAKDLYNEGFDVYAPRLPGMGTCGEDFKNVRSKDFLSVAINAAKALSEEYQELYLVGHSMGGGIAMIVAEEVKKVKKVAVAGPAISSRKGEFMANPNTLRLLSIFKKRIANKWAPDPEYIMYYEDAPADDLYLGKEYWSWIYPKQLLALYDVMLKAGNALYSIDAGILTISGGRDALVGEGSSLLIMERCKANNKHIHLDNATHYFFYDKDKSEEEKAVKAIIDWFK